MESSSLSQTPCIPAQPVAAYIGGKRLLAKQIIQKITAIPHHCYVEPFVGMGGVFFRRPAKPKAEIINDLAGDVANLFRILQRHYPQFMDSLRFQITTRSHFQRLIKTDPATLTDLERAARFLYLQRLSFGGKVAGRVFGVSTENPARFDLTKLEPMLAEAHERLSGVVIECLPYSEVIQRYDRPHTLFYIDPPYWGSEDYYGKEMFAEADFTALADQLSQIKGRFILSINDTPEIREIFSGFPIEPTQTTYTASSGKGKPANELIITGGEAVRPIR